MATDGSKDSRVGLVEVINAPLGFFVLALLIVETFLGSGLLSTKIDSAGTLQCVWFGVALFTLVVGLVTVLVWYKPDSLTFTKEAHLSRELAQMKEQLERAPQVQAALREALFDRTQGHYTEAMNSYQRALVLDPQSEEAQIGLAVAKSYVQPTDLREPLRILDEVIRNNPDSAKAHYNRACMRCLSQTVPKKEWIADLRKAIDLGPYFRDYAKKDEDFKEYWADEDFKAALA